MPVGACWRVVGQVKNREDICGSFPCISDAAAGGAIDTNLRIFAESLSKKWAQQVVIENRPGAGGAISATAAAAAPPDGYTIYAPASSMFLAIQGKAPNLPLKLPRDFTAIGITALQPQSIGINPKLGINSLPELIAQARKKPGSISYAVTGVGRLTHLTGELLQIRGNIQLQMVPYTGGSSQSLPDVTAGRVSLVIEGYAGLAGAYDSGQLKRWQSPRKSVCLRFPMCRPLRKEPESESEPPSA
jgi:tripartite-type tricarboxylate transporter receptor subunit TctC